VTIPGIGATISGAVVSRATMFGGPLLGEDGDVVTIAGTDEAILGAKAAMS
jgi:hypothetical protein